MTAKHSTDTMHDLNLLREMALINARVTAELGPLPPAGIPTAPKRKPNLPCTESSVLTRESGDHEEQAMKFDYKAAVATFALGGTLAACGAETQPRDQQVNPARANQTATTASSNSFLEEAKNAAPLTVNASFNDSGKLIVSAGNITFVLSTEECEKITEELVHCGRGATLTITTSEGTFNQILPLNSVYVDSEQTLYRGRLGESNFHTFILADVNNDGLNDLMIQTGKDGGYGGPSYDVYLFDKKDFQFKPNKPFSDLTVGASGLFIVEDKALKAWAKNGCCEHFYFTYEIRNNQPVLVEKVTEVADGDVMNITTERLIDGTMRVVPQ